MAAAAVSSLACPLRRSSRLTSRRTRDSEENELTPRALRALKRRRLAPDSHPRPKRRRRESAPAPPPAAPAPAPPLPPKDPSPLPLPPPPEPLTPLTPPSPSPDPSPSLPGHDRQSLPPSPPHDPLPPPSPPDPPSLPNPDLFSPPLPSPLAPSLDTLISFDGLHPHFHSDLAVQLPPCQHPPQPLELQDQFHPLPHQQLYAPPPVFVRDREINIWKLACQERVDCLFRRYGVDYIKALVQSEAQSLTQQAFSSSTSQTKFRLYTPASYTYSSTSWGSSSTSRKPFPLDDDDHDSTWPIDDADWVDADVDMEDEDDDDYEDDDDAQDPDAPREGESTIEAVMSNSSAIRVGPIQTDQAPKIADVPVSSLVPATSPLAIDTPLHQTHVFPTPAPFTPSTLPPLSSLHVPLLSEPPRAFMGRGTPPDRRRLIEWSSSGRFTPNGMGPPLYLSPVPQRQSSTDLGILPVSVDPPSSPPPSGEWTSFLYSVLEGDGVGTSVAHPPHAPGPTWYELGLGSVPSPTGLPLPLSSPVGQSVEDATHSSSTLRFALG